MPIRRSYSGGVSQIITKNLIAGVNLQRDHRRGISGQSLSFDPLSRRRQSQGLLAWPVRYIPTRTPAPRCRYRAKYYLPYRAAVTGSYRYYTRHLGRGRQHLRARLHPTDPQCLDIRRQGALLQAEPRRISTAICFPTPTRRTSWRATKISRPWTIPRSAQRSLCVPARRLEVLQARHGHARRQPDSLQLPDFRNIKYYGVPAVSARNRAAVLTSTPTSFRSSYRRSSDPPLSARRRFRA